MCHKLNNTLVNSYNPNSVPVVVFGIFSCTAGILLKTRIVSKPKNLFISVSLTKSY